MTSPLPPADACPPASLPPARRLPAYVLEDPAYCVPVEPPDARAGLSWLRAHVVRFSEGEDHLRRRALTVDLVEHALHRTQPGDGSPVATLLRALDLPADLEPDIRAVAAAYQPHAPQSADADAAADRLVGACGGRTDAAAARVCVLVQTQAGTAALLAARATGRTGPPIPLTRRIAPDGRTVEVDLADAHFGRGAHRCPGVQLADALLGDPATHTAGEPGAQVVTNTWAESPTEP